jgi:hypothetical protein
MTANLSNRTKVAVGGAAVALLILALWFVVVSPKRSDAVKLESEVATAQADLEQRKADLAQPSAAVTVRASDGFRLAKALPEPANVAGVMLDVDRLARAHGLKIEDFLPTAVIPVTGYYAQPLTIGVEGRFGDVSKFVRDLRELVTVKKGRLVVKGRLYSVTEVRLGKADDAEFPVVKAGVVLNASGALPTVPAAAPVAEGETTTPSTDGTSAAGATP